MRFRSLEDPEIKTSQELIVLQIDSDVLRDRPARRVLVPLPDNYQDLITIVNETFGLTVDASNVRFFTQELAGNKGNNVEVTKPTWDTVKSILSTVIVGPHEDAQQLEPRRPARKSIAPPQPDRVVTHDMGAAPTKDVIDAARRLSRMSLAPEDTRRRASRRSFAPSRVSLAPPSNIDEEEAMSTHDGRTYNGDEEEEGIAFQSRGVGRRQIIASEDEDEGEDDEGDENDEVEDELKDELPEDEYVDDTGDRSFTSGGSNPRQQQQPQPPAHVQPPKTPASKAERRNSAQRSNASFAAVTPKLKQERVAPNSVAAKVKNEKEDKPARFHVIEPASRTQTQPEDRFVIIIEYDDGSGEEPTQTMFKTRGRHLVSKVLMQACRTFGIDDIYDKSQLILALETEENGEIVEHRFICPKDETMARVGAEAESRFIVQVEDDL